MVSGGRPESKPTCMSTLVLWVVVDVGFFTFSLLKGKFVCDAFLGRIRKFLVVNVDTFNAGDEDEIDSSFIFESGNGVGAMVTLSAHDTLDAAEAEAYHANDILSVCGHGLDSRCFVAVVSVAIDTTTPPG